MEQDRRERWGASFVAPLWESERAARRQAEATAERIARLQAATAALSAARTPDEVAEVALGAGLSALGGARGFVLVAGPDGALEVLRWTGTTEAVARSAATMRGEHPVSEAFRTAKPVFVESRDALVSRFPDLASIAERMRGGAMAALPLASGNGALGILVVKFDGERRFDEQDRAVATALAGVCAQALERARLLVAERVARAEAVAARRRFAFLDELSEHLAKSAGEAEMLEGVARLSIPALGEWAGVFVNDDGGVPALATSAGPAALGESLGASLRADPLRRLDAACRCGEPAVVDGSAAQPGPDRAFASAAVVPLCFKHSAVGALVVASADPVRRFEAADLALLTDIGRRTALAVQHARLLRDATLAAQAREEFLHVASHELRGPLGTLRLVVQALGRDAGAGDGFAARLRVIDRQAQRLARLADTLLDVSRITAGRLELARENGDLAALVRDVAARIGHEGADATSVEIAVDAPGPLRLAYDPARLDQIVSNLLSNALKYGRGRPVRIAARPDGGRARIEVADEGIGIAPPDQERIFGRFERAVSGRHYGGLGLGLWIVRRLVEAHGGTISVRSAPDEGSTFTVELPLSAATPTRP